jgi:hypothetical protein
LECPIAHVGSEVRTLRMPQGAGVPLDAPSRPNSLPARQVSEGCRAPLGRFAPLGCRTGGGHNRC